MAQFLLSCESTVDVPFAYMHSRGIPVIFYSYIIDEQPYPDDMGRDPEALPRFYAFLDAGKLPKTILYSLNTCDNAAIDTILGCFQNDTAVGRIQHGSAWWFNDHFDGMSEQLKSLGSLGYLAGFIGMLTDSRSFLSYPRHEYFRRILCRIFGEWVEGGFYPDDMDTLKEMVADISYGNAKRYFGFIAKQGV